MNIFLYKKTFIMKKYLYPKIFKKKVSIVFKKVPRNTFSIKKP